jgi:hypothetical protein
MRLMPTVAIVLGAVVAGVILVVSHRSEVGNNRARMAVDVVIGPHARSGRDRTRTALTEGGVRPQRASRLRAAHQRASREQADVVTHWLRRLAAEEGAHAPLAPVPDRPARGA